MEVAERGVVEIFGRVAVLAATDHDVFVTYDVAPELLKVAWQCGSAVAFLRLAHTRPVLLNFLGEDIADLRCLFAHFADQGLPAPATGISVEQPHLAVAAEFFTVRGGGDWAWMWTTDVPGNVALPDGYELTELDDNADAAELLALNAIGSPTAESEPGAGVTKRWFGVRYRGAIVAAGAQHATHAGAPHLAGIVTHPEHRGRSLGRAVTAALTTAAVTDDGICTLGVYSDNAAAIGLYESLGYRIGRSWAARWIS